MMRAIQQCHGNLFCLRGVQIGKTTAGILTQMAKDEADVIEVAPKRADDIGEYRLVIGTGHPVFGGGWHQNAR
ncbi:MAG: hypothetical protein ACKVGZ_08130 [Alphaproteobacteria bacterium]|jgi:hypothetical protein